MKQLLLVLVVGFFANLLQAQSIDYTLRMTNPENHYFQVEMNIKDYKASGDITVKMPVWAPGSYLVREFAKNVNQVKAKDENGNVLPVRKTTKNAWTIQKGKAKNITVEYEVYAFELTVRTSFLDLQHGFVSGTGVFMYVDQLKNKPGNLKVIPHASFAKVNTSLPTGAGQFEYKYTDYDQLADCPIEIGNQVTFDFNAAGVKHTVALFGEGNYDVELLKVDMAKIVEAATNIYGENPNKDYTFIIHNVTQGQGGLEHCNSTTLSVNRFTYAGENYKKFLSLVAHEYFHLWNVKRFRSFELGPFNYDQEAYTSLLWVMEGFTSYYDEILLLRAGYYTEEEYLKTMQSSLNYVEGSVGSRVQSVADASFDAWIKAYRTNENSANTTMTYYTRGGLMAALFDAMLIDKFNGKKDLDGFLRYTYTEYYKNKKRGITEKEFQAELSKYYEADLSDFFNRYIYGTEVPDYAGILGKVGIEVTEVSRTSMDSGASFSTAGGKITVRAIRANSAAEKAGLSVNDELIAINNFRISTNPDAQLNTLSQGDKVQLLVSRDEQILELTFNAAAYKKPGFTLSLAKDAKAIEQRKLIHRSANVF